MALINEFIWEMGVYIAAQAKIQRLFKSGPMWDFFLNHVGQEYEVSMGDDGVILAAPDGTSHFPWVGNESGVLEERDDAVVLLFEHMAFIFPNDLKGATCAQLLARLRTYRSLQAND